MLTASVLAQTGIGLLTLDHPGGLTRLVVEQEEVIQTGDADDPEFQWRPAGRFQLLTGSAAPVGGDPTRSGDEGRAIASTRRLVSLDGIFYYNLSSKTTIAVDPSADPEEEDQGGLYDVHQLMANEETADSEAGLTDYWVSSQTRGARDISGIMRVPAGFDDDDNITGWIEARQTYTLIGDTLQVEYIVTNTTMRSHDVGLRIMFDGSFGVSNTDGQPIILPDGTTIDTEAQLPDPTLGVGSMPDTWVSYDNTSNPNVAIRGTVNADAVTEAGAASKSAGHPDSIAWGVLRNIGNDAQYYFTPNPGVSLVGEDWGYAARWEPVPLSAGESCRFVTYYGVGMSTSNYDRPYAMMAYAPFSLQPQQGDDPSTPNTVENYYLTDRQGRSPFPVSVYLDNFGTQTLLDASVRLKLPTGLELAQGESLTKTIGIVRRNELKSVSWNLHATAARPGSFELKFTGPQGKSLTRVLNIPALPVLNPLESPRGLEMVSIPYEFDNNDAEVVFADLGSLQPGGSATIIKWAPGMGQYKFFPDPLVTNINAGEGYWLLNQARKVINLPDDAEAVPADRAFTLRLPGGWNQIGNPFTVPIRFDTVNIIGPNGGEWTLAEAYRRQLIIPTLFEYDPVENDYAWETRLSDMIMDPYKGYWLLVKDDISLQFPPPGLMAPADAEERADTQSTGGADGWQVPITVTSGGQERTNRAFGVASEATDGVDMNDVIHPPMALSNEAKALSAAFASGSQPVGSGQLLVDMRPPDAENTWHLIVNAAEKGREVTVRWPDLSQMPRDTVPTLIDTATDERCYMRTANAYTFTTLADDENRILKIVGRQRGTDTLSVSGVNAQQARGGQVAITYSLSVPAAVDVTIRNIAGVPVAKVQKGSVSSEGLSTAVWNGRNSRGAPVPSGRYICHLTARSAETGQIANVITTFTMNR
ncbi:MAG: FlgD immunoglobulin-like domain containing protein [Armatimonadota bacterium]